ncbi:FecR family protein [Mucilaginibacter sp. UC70_90]
MFKVTSNKEFPFIVHTSSGNIKVLGTVFNVQAYDSDKLVTSLVTGKVLLQFADQEKYLQAGHRGTISNSGYKDELFDQNRDLGWLSGEAYLNNTPLKEIAPLLNRWYAIKTVFASPDIADIKLSGIVFRDKPITLFLSSIEFSSHLKATLKDSTVYISH